MVMFRILRGQAFFVLPFGYPPLGFGSVTRISIGTDRISTSINIRCTMTNSFTVIGNNARLFTNTWDDVMLCGLEVDFVIVSPLTIPASTTGNFSNTTRTNVNANSLLAGVNDTTAPTAGGGQNISSLIECVRN